MRYVPSDKYNVAWFKLAECVSRGEKERALGVYRLLAHSFEDRAYASQLEGDILLSCDDTAAAVEKFKEAIELYRKDGRILQAAALGEHLFSLTTKKKEAATLLLELYTIVGMRTKIVSHGHFLISSYLKNNDLDRALAVMEQVDISCLVDETAVMRKMLVIALCRNRAIPKTMLFSQLEKTIDGFLLADDDNQLQRLLIEIAEMNDEYQAHALAYVASK